MAILGSNFLNGCSSIPGFMRGLAENPGTPSLASRTIFEQSTAPSSWVKVTNASYNNRALRVIGGIEGRSLSPGGSTVFTSIFTASKSLSPFDVTLASSNISVQAESGYITSQNTDSNLSVQNVAGTNANMRSHNHPYLRAPGSFGAGAAAATQRATPNSVVTVGTTNRGAGGQHNHGISDGQHNHPVSPGNHAHPVSITQHDHTFTMTGRNFALLYIDIIVCQKS
jgi:hypothetical protein